MGLIVNVQALEKAVMEASRQHGDKIVIYMRADYHYELGSLCYKTHQHQEFIFRDAPDQTFMGYPVFIVLEQHHPEDRFAQDVHDIRRYVMSKIKDDHPDGITEL